MLEKTKEMICRIFSGRWRGDWVAVILAVFLLAGCGGSSNDAEPELEDVPAESEELEPIQFEEIQDVEARVSVSSGSTLAIRRSPGTEDQPEDDVVDRVPRGRILRVIDKHGDNRVEDGYTWWEVEDTESGSSGWTAAEFLEVEDEADDQLESGLNGIEEEFETENDQEEDEAE